MAGPRKLWTAPCGSSSLGQAIERASTDSSSLWLVPSRLAAEQIRRAMAARSKAGPPCRVWSWDDAWGEVARAQRDVPARLSPASLRAVLAEAIERALRARTVDVLAGLLEFPGYRRQLIARFRAWTRAERPVDAPPPGDQPEVAEEWSIYRGYRETLRQVGGEDPEGWSAWASRALTQKPPEGLRKPGQVVVIDPVRLDRAAWRLLDYGHQRARSMTVTLPFDPEPSLAELYAEVADVRRQFLAWGFAEESEPSGGLNFRAPGLGLIEKELFRADAHRRPPIRLERDQGLKILGGPQGEGLGLLVAREVRDLVARGVHPDEVLVLVPQVDEQAERTRDALVAWSIPVADLAGTRLSKVPAISALGLLMSLPVEDWEVSTLARVLRNGQVRRPDLEGVRGFGRQEAASAIRATRVFRDRDSLRRALETAREDPARGRSAGLGLRCLDAFADLVDSTTGSGPWPVQVERLRRLALGAGIDPDALELLWDTLDDHGWVLERLGAAIAAESYTWAEFAREVRAIVSEVEASPRPAPSGAIRILPVEAAEGVWARFVILANLSERSFPAPGSINPDPGPSPDPNERPSPAYSREMLRFARVAASAEDQVVLAYPTTDIYGESLLPAGFLDDLIRRLDPRSLAACVERHARFDPVLVDHPDLATAPADARVRAVALAFRGDHDALRALASDPSQAEALLGTADAFEVAHRRRVDRDFGPYDGRLIDESAIARVRESFGPDHAFSPSQLESFALCPFQFFQRYVLGLKKVDEREELDEDYAGRGTEVHDVLERIHQQAASEGAEHLIGRLGVLIETHVRVDLESHLDRPGSVPQALREIASRRTGKALARYAVQFGAYAGRDDVVPTPLKFEVVFGQDDEPGATESLPHLTLGEDERRVRLQGKIDRIDLVHRDGQPRFRVIDYKTGSNPSGKDVLSGLASQLPLYALAVEQLIFPEGAYELGDVGYWSLPNDGYKAVKIKEWAAYRDLLMGFVVDSVARLRGGDFPIESQKKECWKYCDYRAACRVLEVRMVGKTWLERPILGDQG